MTDWTSIDAYAAGGTLGKGIINTFQPTVQPTDDGGYRVVSTATNVLWFSANTSGGYTPSFYDQHKLTTDSSGNFILTDPQGAVTTYYGFGSGVPTAEQGKFKSRVDVDGLITSTTYNSAGQLTSEQRTDGTSTETYLFSYLQSGANAGLTSSITMQRSSGAATPTTIRTATFTYYDGSQSYGNLGDLQFERVYDGSNNLLDTTYYRYYTAADAGTTGYVDGLKYVYHAEAYARLAAAVSNPAAATDSQVSAYANNYYEYDSDHRVVTSTMQGSGCSCDGSTGLGTYSYSYTLSNNPDGINNWKVKTTETLPDHKDYLLHQLRRRTDLQGDLGYRRGG